MNNWLLTKIREKADASPLGIVMFNRCTDKTYSGSDVIKAIIKMNSKFYLKHAGANTNNTGGNATQDSPIASAAANYDSGMKDFGKNAISWESSE